MLFWLKYRKMQPPVDVKMDDLSCLGFGWCRELNPGPLTTCKSLQLPHVCQAVRLETDEPVPWEVFLRDLLTTFGGTLRK